MSEVLAPEAFIRDLVARIAARRSREAVEFWDVHEVADAEHSEVGDNIVVRHATDAATQAQVRDALQHSLDAWWQFFDGIQTAI